MWDAPRGSLHESPDEDPQCRERLRLNETFAGAMKTKARKKKKISPASSHPRPIPRRLGPALLRGGGFRAQALRPSAELCRSPQRPPQRSSSVSWLSLLRRERLFSPLLHRPPTARSQAFSPPGCVRQFLLFPPVLIRNSQPLFCVFPVLLAPPHTAVLCQTQNHQVAPPHPHL